MFLGDSSMPAIGKGVVVQGAFSLMARAFAVSCRPEPPDNVRGLSPLVFAHKNVLHGMIFAHKSVSHGVIFPLESVMLCCGMA